MFKLGKGPAGKAPTRPGAHLDLRDAALHVIEQLRRAARDVGDQGLESETRRVHIHLGRASTDAELESVALDVLRLTWSSEHRAESEGSQDGRAVVAECAEAAMIVARAVGIVDFPEGLKRVTELKGTMDFARLLGRFGLEQERIAEGVLFLRQTSEILRCSVTELVGALGPLADDEPAALSRLLTVRDRLERTADLRELERLREQLVEAATQLVDEAKGRAERATEAHHLARLHESHVKVLELALADAATMASTDPLTGLGNRRCLDRFVEHQKTQPEEVGLVALDVDHFKRVNDSHGHDVGDRVLRMVAEVLRQELRGADHAYRVGGEEFLVLLPGTALPGTQATAERLCAQVEAQLIHVAGREALAVTVSAGVSQWGSGLGFQRALKAADEALYRAKQLGRNQVVTRVV